MEFSLSKLALRAWNSHLYDRYEPYDQSLILKLRCWNEGIRASKKGRYWCHQKHIGQPYLASSVDVSFWLTTLLSVALVPYHTSVQKLIRSSSYVQFEHMPRANNRNVSFGLSIVRLFCCNKIIHPIRFWKLLESLSVVRLFGATDHRWYLSFKRSFCLKLTVG